MPKTVREVYEKALKLMNRRGPDGSGNGSGDASGMTGQDVFNVAMGLMDELDRTGAASNSDTQEYAFRAPAILTTLVSELALCLDSTDSSVVLSLSSPLPSVPDAYAVGAMPLGLASHLLADENPTAASFFEQRYEELRERYVSEYTRLQKYEERAVGITDTLLAEFFMLTGESSYITPEELDDDIIGVDDTVAASIFPFGLASHLIMEEDPKLGTKLHEHYYRLLNDAASRLGAEVGEIENLYGGIEYGRFGRW